MKRRNNRRSLYEKTIALFVAMIACVLFSLLNNTAVDETNATTTATNAVYTNTDSDNAQGNIDINNIPTYNGTAYVELNGGIPDFNENDFTTEPFEHYSELDDKGRCGVAFANICKEIMPKENEERGQISYKPTGWVQNEYPYLIESRYLYNRCHLIAWQLASENNNKQNLITGTTYMNKAMIEWENKVANYVKENEGYHVLYRVTPIFEGDNLLASGVHMEAMSVEERENGVCFNIYIYNVQPNIALDYATGENYEKLLLTE